MKLLLVCLLWASLAGIAAAQDAPQAAANDVAGIDRVAIEFGDAQDVISFQVKLTYWLDAPVEEVWEKMLEIDRWWPHTYETDSEVIIEPWAGGRIYERFNELEQGGLYGHVVYIKENFALKSDGQWALPGASVSGGVWKLEPAAGGTLVTQSGEVIGSFDPDLMKGRETGYQAIVDALRAFVEQDQPCERYLNKLHSSTAGGE